MQISMAESEISAFNHKVVSPARMRGIFLDMSLGFGYNRNNREKIRGKNHEPTGQDGTNFKKHTPSFLCQ